MVESQPGTVAAFNPSVSLSNFSAGTRDQLIFNGNQLVLAKLQQARATLATARTRLSSTEFVDYDEYINLAGDFVYIDGSYQALDTRGAPSTPVHQIVVGFDQQVTTDNIVFWSTIYVDTTEVYAEYSYDNVTWFDVGAITWVQYFDDTIEVFPGDIPPTGEYRYTGTFDGGSITARYWRLRSDYEQEILGKSGTSPTITLTVASTTKFPSSGSLYVSFGTTWRTLTYTAKTSTTFTGVTEANADSVNTAVLAILGQNPDITLVLSDASNLPSSGAVRGGPSSYYAGLCTPVDENSPEVCYKYRSWTATYTSKVGNTLYGVVMYPDPDEVFQYEYEGYKYTTIRDNTTLYNATYTARTSQVGDVVYKTNTFGAGVTEVQIVPTQSPVFQHWNSDGSQAVTNAVEGADYYVAAYDKTDEVYYALRFNHGVEPSQVIGPSDDFNGDTGAGFDTTRWKESDTNLYFQHSTLSGTADHRSSGGNGQLTTLYGVDDSFLASIELVALLDLGPRAYFALEAKDYNTGNVHLLSAIRGSYPDLDATSRFVGATMTFSDTVGSAAELQDFRVNVEGMRFNASGGRVDYALSYSTVSGTYAVTASGVSKPPVIPGLPYSMDSVSFTVSNLTEPAEGQGFDITVWVAETTIAGTVASGTALQIQRAGTNGYCRYADSSSPGSMNTLLVSNTPSARAKLQLYSSPVGDSIDLSADNFVATADSLFYDTPVFSVVTLDKSGELKQVSGISDADGYAIKAFDIIRDPNVTYNRYLSPRTGIATNGASAGAGGEIYIKVDDAIYRYTKTALPLVEDNGASAAAVVSGTIGATGVTNFAYNGYTGGGLSYIEYLPDLEGVFVRTIDSSTLAESPLKALLDVASISYPFAWHVVDLATLYFVDGTALKLYDMNEAKAGFVNVTSDKQVLAAGTSETATITAQVLNVYGEPKSAKSMVFSVSAGDGAISPATGCSDANGEDTTTYTVGSSVGTATITVTVSDVTCVP